MLRLFAIGLTWLALAGLSLAIGLVFFNPFPDYRLAKSSVRTEGRVTALEPANHEIVRYAYRVGAEYNGSGHGGSGNPVFRNLRVGESVIVFYDPAHPEVSSLGYPEGPLSGNLWGVISTTLFLPICIIFVLYRLGYFR